MRPPKKSERRGRTVTHDVYNVVCYPKSVIQIIQHFGVYCMQFLSPSQTELTTQRKRDWALDMQVLK